MWKNGVIIKREKCNPIQLKVKVMEPEVEYRQTNGKMVSPLIRYSVDNNK